MSSRLCILTGAYDDQYLALRGDEPPVCTSTGKRLKLYAALEEATGIPPLILSPQPRGRLPAKECLPAVNTRFGIYEQRFCRSSRLPKIRILANLFYYAVHVDRHAPDDAVFIIDNYELIYVLAVWLRVLRGKRCRVILEYEDGKHQIDRGVPRLLSSLAELLGRPLVKAGILATPVLSVRLPGVPVECVPGILNDVVRPSAAPAPSAPVEFIYSGSLDVERGLPLLLDFLESTAVPPRALFHITGQGLFSERCREVAARHPTRLIFHGTVEQAELERLRARCHFGLNLQRSGNPISEVTFPSKTFDYLNAGLRIISTRAAGVPQVLGEGAIYLPAETVEGLSTAVGAALETGNPASGRKGLDGIYSHSGTVLRLRQLFARSGVI